MRGGSIRESLHQCVLYDPFLTASDSIHLVQVREEVPVPEVPSKGFLVKVLAAGGTLACSIPPSILA